MSQINNGILIVIILLLITFNIFTCNKGNPLFEPQKEIEYKTIELSKKQIKVFTDSISLIKTEKERVLSERDSLEKLLAIRNKKSTKKIAEAKALSEDSSKVLVQERFKSFKAINLFAAYSDSISGVLNISKLKIELLTKENNLHIREIDNLESIVIEKDIQLITQENLLDISDAELLAEKKKKPKIFIRGVAVGVTLTVATLVYLNLTK